MEIETITVGMADLKVCKMPKTLTTLSLGSCIGLVFYDMRAGVAGMLHYMLPSRPVGSDGQNRAKFGDTGIEDMHRQMIRLGANSRSIRAKMAGGAHMFNTPANDDIMKVGKRNRDMAVQML